MCAKLKKFASPHYKNNTRGNNYFESVTTVGHLLTRTTPWTLLKILDPLLTMEEVQLFLHRVAKVCCPPPQTALELLQQSQQHANAKYLPTGWTALDNCLRGGIRIGSLTEFCGRAGAGKTQLAMQLCVTAAARCGQGTVYLDTEQKLSLTRLQEIVQHQHGNGQLRKRPRTHEYDDGTTTNMEPTTVAEQQQQVLDNVTVLSPTTMPDLMTALLQIEELVLDAQHDNSNKLPIGLVIVDSIAAPAKRGAESAPERAAALFQCAQRLKQMADQLQLAILVVNQVALERSSFGGGVRVKAALGTSWRHCVSTRIMMEQQQQLEAQPQQQSGSPFVRETARTATIVKSNLVGLQSVKYQIVGAGVVDAVEPPVARIPVVEP
eukprot:Sro1964_g308190.1 RAD51 homolog 3 (379) ;mRNA; r:8265-9401